MALCAAGSEAAFTALVERYHGSLRRYFEVAGRDAEGARDLVQETLLRVYQHRVSYRPGGVFRRWLFTIAANLARSQRRTQQRRPAPGPLPAGGLPAGDPGPEQALLAAERVARIRAALGELPAPQREALRLRLLEGLDFDSIGAALGCPTATARTRCHYGLKALRAQLDPGSGATP